MGVRCQGSIKIFDGALHNTAHAVKGSTALSIMPIAEVSGCCLQQFVATHPAEGSAFLSVCQVYPSGC